MSVSILSGAAGGISQAAADARYLQIGQGGITQAFADGRYVQFAIAFQAFRFDSPGGMGVGIQNLDASKTGSAGLAISAGTGSADITQYGNAAGGTFTGGVPVANSLHIGPTGDPGQARIVLDGSGHDGTHAIGFFRLVPMADGVRNAILAAPQLGTMMFSATRAQFERWDGSAWVAL